MPSLYLTIGLPGSGKTTLALSLQKNTPGLARVNRDDLRMMLFGAYVLDRESEKVVTIAQQAQVRALLAAGTSVIVDDTNLHARFRQAWVDIAQDTGAELRIIDLRHISVQTCKDQIRERVAQGGRHVPDHVVERMAATNAEQREVIERRERAELLDRFGNDGD